VSNPGCATAAAVSQKTEQFLLRRAHSNLNLYKILTPPIPFPFSRFDQIKRSTTVGVAHIEIKEP
jgi:hypothetical protein